VKLSGKYLKKRSNTPGVPPASLHVRMAPGGEDLRLPAELRRRWNLTGNSKLLLRDTPEGLFLYPADPPLRKVYLEPTSACNLRCRTCVRTTWTEPTGFMELSTFRKLLDDLKRFPSLQEMAFWGVGEPLYHGDIVEMVALAHARGLRTEIVTNGVLLDRPMAKGLVKAGLDTLVVSVDGVTSESYVDIRCGGDLTLVKDNVMELRRVREELSRKNPEVGLEFVVMRRNVDQLPELAYTAFSLGATFIVVTNLLPYTEELQGEILYELTATTRNDTPRTLAYPELLLPRIDMRPEYMAPLLKLMQRVGRPSIGLKAYGPADDDHCPFIGRGSLAVSWTGDVSPCVALMHSYRCFVIGREKFIRRYAVGNILTEKIHVIWNKKEYRDFRRRVATFDFAPCLRCGSCQYAESNEEDCFGNPHPVCGDCLWARRVILCP
jgi:MoaA/NifB/PqqE/SkfB family radical SAM enzyme